MQVEFNGDWKMLLVAGAILLAVLMVMSMSFGILAGLILFILRSVWLVLKFAFSSIVGFAVFVAASYLIYRGYEKLKSGKQEKEKTMEYTSEDFER